MWSVVEEYIAYWLAIFILALLVMTVTAPAIGFDLEIGSSFVIGAPSAAATLCVAVHWALRRRARRTVK